MTYDFLAEMYDDYFLDEFYEKYLNIILNHKSGGSLIDIGCGTGRFIELASEYFLAMGIDQSDEMIKKARKRCDSYFECTDFLTFDIHDQFTVVTMILDVINHFDDLKCPLQKIKDLMAEDGILVFDYLTDKYVESLDHYTELINDDIQWEVTIVGNKIIHNFHSKNGKEEIIEYFFGEEYVCRILHELNYIVIDEIDLQERNVLICKKIK